MLSSSAQGRSQTGAVPRGVWPALGLLVLLALVPHACSDDPKLVAVPEPGTAVLQVAGRTVTVELATDVATRTRGMMHRLSLGPERGMLFIFPDTIPRVFWMRNTLIPLDIIFLDDDGLVINIEEAPPAVEKPGFHSLKPARFVLEFNRGWSAEHGLKPGQKIEINQALRDRATP
jgi:uncharacterized membrane protein (UPF0127 family)